VPPPGPRDLADAVGHELRTPLTAIRGYAEALSDSAPGELAEPQRAMADAILRGALRLQEAVDRLEAALRDEAAAARPESAAPRRP
jgi:signal transduction histidine kinase